jgi:hypothetical protein
MRRGLGTRLREERGFAMAAVVALTAALAIVGVILIETVTSEQTRAVANERGGTALQAAEAGLDDYLAKLVEDKTYYFHHVHPAEGTRRPTSGADVDPSTSCVAPKTATGVAWTGSISWTYPNGRDNWCQLANGYEYSLQITPPSATSTVVKLVSTGRKIGSTTSNGQWRSLEQWVHFTLITDFQMIAAGNYSAGSTATTNGKVYAGGTLNHDGIAHANLYSETTITGGVSMQSGSVKYPSTTIRSQIASPINFANFQSSLDDIERAADTSGVHLGSTYPAWKIVFNAAGTFTASGCPSGANVSGTSAPTCTSGTATYTVPSNGAVFSDVDVIVSGVVNGRVTVASNDDGIIGGNITYATSGDDVLGVIGKNNITVAKYAPSTLSWRAAVIAQTGRRSSYDSTGSHTLADHYGSTATYLSPYMDMFATRNYYYDSTLQYLPPPWFPALDDAYVVDLFREVTP